jgi:hypothetical protein
VADRQRDVLVRAAREPGLDELVARLNEAQADLGSSAGPLVDLRTVDGRLIFTLKAQ